MPHFRLITLLVLLILILLGWSSPASTRDLIRVVMDDNYPPYVFRDGKGNLQGILVDQWHCWEKQTGVRVQISAMDWGEAQRRMERGEFDCIDTIFRTPRREEIYDFTKPYARLDVPIFVSRDIGGIRGVEDLSGFSIAVKSGGAVIDFIRKRVDTTIVEYPSYEAIIRDAAAGKVKIFTEERPPAMYYLHKYRIADRFRETPPMYSGEFHRAVRKGDGELLSLIQRGFDSIDHREMEKIDRKWMGSEVGNGEMVRWLEYLLLAALCIFVLLFAWVKILRRMVSQRTRELEVENAIRRRREEELAESHAYQMAIFNLVSDAIFIHDPEDGRILDVNDRTLQMFGTIRDEMIGKSVGPFSDGPSREVEEKALVMIRRAVTDGDQTFEWRGRRSDGGVIPLEVSLTHAVVSGKEVVIASVRDITDRLDAERERENLQRIESLGYLAGGIAHDFNNILTAIVGNVSIARSQIDPDHPVQERLQRVERGVDRAVALTRQLLTFAKGGAPVRRPVDTVALVAESVSFSLHGSTVLTEVELPPDLPPMYADEGQISQCLNNLLINARQAMPQGGTIRIVGSVVTVEGRRFVEIRVSDEGEGIPPEIIDRIFDPYFTTKETGSGLGLATVYSIVRKHGGDIGVESVVGRGSTFWMHIPAAEESPHTEGVTSSDGVMTGGRILVMDDDPDVRMVAEDILSAMGFDCETVEDGSRAVDRYGEALVTGMRFDLVILDLTVRGGVGGVETARMIREIDMGACIMVSSGYSDDPVFADPSGYGFDGVIRKPFGRDVMLSVISQVRRRCVSGGDAS
ncbi:MAG: hypothetical protein Fur0034_10990 [Desulfuromonadia bacterium]